MHVKEFLDRLVEHPSQSLTIYEFHTYEMFFSWISSSQVYEASSSQYLDSIGLWIPPNVRGARSIHQFYEIFFISRSKTNRNTCITQIFILCNHFC